MVCTLQSSTGAQSAASNLLLARAHKKFEAIVIWDSPSYIPLNFQTAWLSWSILHFLKYTLQKQLKIDFAPLILLASSPGTKMLDYGQWLKQSPSIVAISELKSARPPNILFLVPSAVCNRGDTIQYHVSLRSRELGQATLLLVFLTPRQALSSHLCQQMVWLYWLQDRDSMPNLSIWPFMLHPWFPTRKASKLTFVCFQFQLFSTM